MICKKHGPLEEADIYTRPSGERECRVCGREAMKRFRRSRGRRTYKQYLAEKRGEELPLAAIRPRKYKRKKHALLTRQQVFAAYRLYESGMTAVELAERGWRKWGYRNAETAEKCLRHAWRLEGFSVRSGSEAMLLRPSQQSCNECGVGVGERTKGCMACARRHWYRQKQGLPFVNAKNAARLEERRAA